MIRLYNSKTLQIEPFRPVKEGHVSMYVCGPTVYNYAHIGNARPMVVFDVLKRLFEAEGYTVTYVSNFTDVDDKIINRAIEENTTEAVIAQRYIDAYQALRVQLNTQIPDITPRVTETMDDIIAFIQEMVNNGSAYVSDCQTEMFTSLLKQMKDMVKSHIRIWICWKQVHVLMSIRERRIHMTLLCGKRQTREFSGIPHGEREDLDGTRNVLS